MQLLSSLTAYVEAGVDEAGRGPLAGPVYAAAVILPSDVEIPGLDDSKKLSEKKRYELRPVIEAIASDFSVAYVDNATIDKINILNATYLAMHKALDGLKKIPEYILVDGNRFKPYKNIPFRCIVKGDGKFLSIAAASVLAKTYRDDFMNNIAKEFPQYGWEKNKGYGTKGHFQAIEKYGLTPYHRRSFLTKFLFKLDL
jgi:ribonuclease HII